VTKVVTVEQMRAVEAAADQQKVTYADMMEHAGRAVAEAIQARLGDASEVKITVLAGPGNNGGDGLVAARYLAEAGAAVSIYLSKMRDESDENLAKAREAGLFIVDGENDQRWRVLKNLMHGASVVVDALLGTGATLPVKGTIQHMLDQTARVLRERRPRPLVVAVDCPSGLDCDSGAVDPATLAADLTVTFAAAKLGHFGFPAADFVGELQVADIGVPAKLDELAGVQLELASLESVAALLPARPRNAHKGTFGRAIVVAGSVNFTGAAYFAGASAYRVGTGLVTLASPMPLYGAIAAKLPEATWLILPHEMGVIAPGAVEVLTDELEKSESLVLGPGFGQEKATGDFLRKLLKAEEHKRGRMGFIPSAEPDAEQGEPHELPPTVLDADGLRLLAEIDGWPALLRSQTVLTPHPGEMAALTGLETQAIQADRLGTAQKSAAEWGHVVVLKGAFTVVAAPDGRTTLQPFATAALARAGTGDVLAGAIGGLLAQGVAPYEAAVAGAYLHGLAGQIAAERLGTTASVLASDVLAALPEAVSRVEKARAAA
jgi:ADP-dependent NAD(P)H-hydrate dehydratase / NAD(P)H-hydrate epimerase